MNMNMIIGKRQIILAALVVGMGVAVYLNWQYSNEALDLPVAQALELEAEGRDSHYGEGRYVDNQGFAEEMHDVNEVSEDMAGDWTEAETYFVEAKMSRQKARDEAVETLAVMLSEASLEGEQKVQLAMRATDLAKSIETEGKIENLIKAKGFSDVMVYYDAQRADIMIRTEGLVSGEVMQIKDIILKETAIPVENISIIEVN